MRKYLRAALVAIAIGAVYFIGNGVRAFSAPPANGSAAPEFTGINQWLNSPPLSMQALRGKVVLVDFWTYSCVNCINTLPHVKQWYEKYKDQGLVVVGVHTPEYAFEKSTANVEAALSRLDVRYPVAQDNAYGTWSAFRNEYWPALYLIDADGRIVYQHFGEGGYAKTEAVIQKLLAERKLSQPA
ncbi:thioredoxin family protein [Cupriavidus lacunae]|uniref:Thioredoxin n=1 Tax=Cupriavidus lacunae TaxID=2666307 RepID=A0A370NQY0_9BURK|nr:thioredoxin family protein [Cupriavidus lacunae]RDK07938.1 thioredoxin [Cupriavidus lacunae]